MRLFVLGLLILLPASQAAFASLDDTLLSIVPHSSTVLAGIDVRRATASRSGNYVLEQTIRDQDFAKLTTLIGLNVRRDLRQMLLVGLGPQTAPNSPRALIADGPFDPLRLIATGTSRGALMKRYSGFSILVKGTGKAVSGVAFPRAGVLILGDLATVQALLDSEPSSSGMNPTLREQVNRIGPTSDIWFATVLPGSFLAHQMGDALPPQIGSSELLDRISQSSGGLRFGQSDELRLDLSARSAGDARLISGLLHLGGSLAHLQIGGDAGVLLAQTVLSSMQIAVEGSTVYATSVMPDAQLEQLLASAN